MGSEDGLRFFGLACLIVERANFDGEIIALGDELAVVFEGAEASVTVSTSSSARRVCLSETSATNGLAGERSRVKLVRDLPSERRLSVITADGIP